MHGAFGWYVCNNGWACLQCQHVKPTCGCWCELKGDPREPLQTSFSHPAAVEKVFVMMDPCHMLKLAHNVLQVNDDRLGVDWNGGCFYAWETHLEDTVWH